MSTEVSCADCSQEDQDPSHCLGHVDSCSWVLWKIETSEWGMHHVVTDGKEYCSPQLLEDPVGYSLRAGFNCGRFSVQLQ